jgi:sRNA-binding protein
MSNPSLKDQLKALSMGLSSSPTESPEPRKEKKKINRPLQATGNEKGGKQKPAWLEHAQYGVELLKAHFPSCFKELKEISPLKVGIKQDLVKHLSTREDIVLSDKACMVGSLAYYVNSVAYHKSMQAGMVRIDLEGNSVGVVTEEEAQYSAECRKSKLQKKQPTNTPATSLQDAK